MWLTGLNNEILVLDELNPPHSTKEIESKLSLVRGLAAQAQTDLEWLLDSLARRQSPIEILLLDRSPERTGAVVKIDNKLRQVTFSRVDGTLLLASITSDENQTTLRFEFKDHYRFGDRWIPRTVEFEEHHAQRGTMRALYSQLTLAEDQPGMPDFEEHFMIPEPENTNMTRVLAAEIFSQAFPGGVKMEIAPSFPQLGVMREAQK
jgi:hypothetical protein